MREADIVTMHCPLMESTYHLIHRENLALMKKNAIFINAARGPVVDSQALADALTEGRIAAAGVDVYETEPPLPADHRSFILRTRSRRLTLLSHRKNLWYAGRKSYSTV